MKSTERILITLLALLLTAVFGERRAEAQIDVGVEGGYNLDTFSSDGPRDGTLFLGGQARLGLAGLPIVLNPGADYYFNDLSNTSVWQINADALLPLGPNNVLFTPYVGLGLGITHVSMESNSILFGDLLDQSETNYGANVIGGATFGSGSVRPFVEARISLGNHFAFLDDDGGGGSGYMVLGGLLFRLGR